MSEKAKVLLIEGQAVFTQKLRVLPISVEQSPQNKRNILERAVKPISCLFKHTKNVGFLLESLLERGIY